MGTSFWKTVENGAEKLALILETYLNLVNFLLGCDQIRRNLQESVTEFFICFGGRKFPPIGQEKKNLFIMVFQLNNLSPWEIVLLIQHYYHYHTFLVIVKTEMTKIKSDIIGHNIAHQSLHFERAGESKMLNTL